MESKILEGGGGFVQLRDIIVNIRLYNKMVFDCL